MLKRLCYRAQSQKGKIDILKDVINKSKESLKQKNILTLSLLNSEDTLFLYYECVEDEIVPDRVLGLISQYLKPWPHTKDESLWVPMYDIFHYNKPLGVEQWKRKTEGVNVRPIGKVARLRPEMISSYIFYHYQYQEEKPGDGDKYGIINLHENLMFFYLEEPCYKEEADYKGVLNTCNTPGNWAEVMEPHFIYWEDTEEKERIWKDTELIVYM